MGIGKRIAQLFRANINDMLNAAEDPEKQMDLALEDMQTGLRQAKQELVRLLAEEKRLQRELDQADELTKLWEGKAQQAVAAGRDDLARESLRKKRTYEDLANELDARLAEQQKAVDTGRAEYKMLEKKVAEMGERRRALSAEKVRRSRERRPEGARAIDTTLLKDRSAFDKFEEMADKVERFESETVARREVEDLLAGDDELAREIDRLSGKADAPAGRGGARVPDDRELKVDIELEELRKRAGRTAPPATPAAEEAPHERRSQRRGVELDSTPPPAADAPRDAPDEDSGDGGQPDRRVEL